MSSSDQRNERRAVVPDICEQISCSFTIPSKALSLAFVAAQARVLVQELLSDQELQWFDVAVREAMQNSHEHGNLGITGAEKRSLVEAEEFEAHLKQREQEAVDGGKKLFVSFEIAATELSCCIKDQGDGFDWKKLRGRFETTPAEAGDPRGRGLFLIENFFDVVEYNDRGNEVTLRKKLPRATSQLRRAE